MTSVQILSYIFAAAVIVIPVISLVSRMWSDKGIGWQFIRFNVIAMSIPTIAVLALNNLLSSETISGLIGAIVGYAFARSTDGGRAP
jgi:hypothetical protein